MTKPIQNLIVYLVTLLISIPLVAQAQTIAQVKANPQLESDLEEAIYLVRTKGLLNYSEVKTANDFVNVFAKNRPAAEKMEIKKRISSLKNFPKLKPVQYGVKFTEGDISLEIDMRPMQKNRFVVNGMPFTMDLTSPLPMQADILVKKLQGQKSGKKSAMVAFLIPEAHAVVPAAAVWVVVGMVGTAFLNKSLEELASTASDGVKAFNFSVCNKMRASKASALENPFVCKDSKVVWLNDAKNDPALNAAKGSEPDKEKKELFKTLEEECPYQNGDKAYVAKVKIMTFRPEAESLADIKKSDKKEPADSGIKAERVVRLFAELGEGKLKNGYLLELVPGQYDSTGNPKFKEVGKYVVDAQLALTEIVIPKIELTEAQQEEIKDASELKIKAAVALDDKATISALREYHKGIFQHLGDRLKYCKTKKGEIEANEASKKRSSPSSTGTGAQ